MSTAKTLRRLALSFPEADEKPHFDRSSFRVRNKIFATLNEGDNTGVVKLPIPDQTALVGGQSDIFFLAGWAHQGWTGIRFEALQEKELRKLLETAWKQVAPKKLVAAHDAK